MSRQKVPDDKRQRTAQACDYCKRRKQKCNGAKPCSTCIKKTVTCTYSTGVGSGPGTGPESASSATSRPSTDDMYDGASSSASPPKRRHIETPSSSSSDVHMMHHHQQVFSHHNTTNSINSISSITSAGSSSAPLSQPKVEIDAKARLKLRSMPSVPAPLSSASRPWSGRKKEVSIELETSFLHNAGQAQGPTTGQQPTTTVQDSTRSSSGAAIGDHTRASSTSGHEEEAVMFHTSRMLKDQNGRLLYVGDSATLSFLHLFRIMVERITGESSFTNDPNRGNIVENLISLPERIHPPCMLPDRKTVDVLVESFFINTISLIAIFDRRDFFAELESCYSNPLRAENRFLCLLYMAMAIGLIMATPVPGSDEEAIIRAVRDQSHDQAELFFRSAKCLANPLDNIEETDFWSVQALTLTTVYMLAASRRNTAYSFHGMAVRSAIAIGLHRNEAMVKLPQDEVELRCNLWKSLYVLDRFISAALGRPTAISDNDCTDNALKDSVMPPQIARIDPPGHASASSHSSATGGAHGSYSAPSHSLSSVNGIENNFGFDTTVRSCRIIGIILRKMYARRRVSSRVTLDIAKQCVVWQKEIGDSLRWKRAVESSAAVAAGQEPLLTRAQSIAILHVNLVYCHGVILLTRPFFLFLIQIDRRNNQTYRREFGRFFQDISKHGSIKVFKSVVNDNTGTANVVTSVSRITGVSGLSRTNGYGSRFSPLMRARSEKLAENCIVASFQTIAMIHQARAEKYLIQRDPFIIHFLFTAILLILCNEFTAMFRNMLYREYLDKGLDLMSYFSEMDPQARRLIHILYALRDVVDKYTGCSPKPASFSAAAAPGTGATNSCPNPATKAVRAFRSKIPGTYIPGVSDPVDNFFPQDIFGGSSVPFGHRPIAGGQVLGSYHGSHTPAEMVTAPGSAPGQTQMPGYGGDIKFFGRQGAHDLSQSSLPSPAAAAMPGSMADNVAFMGGNNDGSGNPPVLPPPYPMSGAEFASQGPSQAQHPHEQHHPYQHHMNFNSMSGSAGFGQEAYGAVVDNKSNGDYDGTDSIETDGEGFDFEIFWNWHSHIDQPGQVGVDGEQNTAGSMEGVNMGMPGMGEGMTPIINNNVQQQEGDGGTASYGDLGPAQGQGSGGEMGMKGSAPAQIVQMPLPPIYSPYGMVALPGGVGDTSGMDMSGTNVHGMLPLNVPLYATAELG